MQNIIQLDPRDNVCVAVLPLHAGTRAECAGQALTTAEEITSGHKLALRDIGEGEHVIKYGASIGLATRNIRKGEHIHSHNLRTGLSGLLEYAYPGTPEPGKALPPRTFMGYMRPDGSAGTRNDIYIVPTVGCVNGTARTLARMASERFPNAADSFLALTHDMGCSQLGEDMECTRSLLAGLIRNPNAGGVLVLGLGCENNYVDSFRPYLKDCRAERIRFLVAQECEDEIERGMQLLEELAHLTARDRRCELPASYLTLGFKCGGSDAFSGITANPLCGRIADRLTAMGGKCILTEVPEMFGAEQILLDRCADLETFEAAVGMINGFKAYYIRHGQPIYENPSPGNKEGGITTLEEKSLGCIRKGGDAIVTDVLPMGGFVRRPGLSLLTGPGNDLISCTNLAAAGASLIVFTTGRGNPFCAPVPTVKLASNTPMASRKQNWIDYSAGALLESGDFDAEAERFMDYLLRVASGECLTRGEQNGSRGIALFRDGVIL